MIRVILASKCAGVKSGECAVECPVDCIHPTKEEPDFANVDQLYINPNECISCGRCELECPVDAIVTEDEAPQEDIDKNAAYFKR